MRRLSARAFEMTTGAKAWSPAEEASSVGAMEKAPSQPEIYRKAYLEGFEAGFADGDKEARRALQEIQGIARTTVESVRAEKERWCAALASLVTQFAQAEKEHETQMEALAVTIAFAATCRLVGRMHADNDLVAALCREALESMHLQPTLLRIAPADQVSLEKNELALPTVADVGLEPGDCVIETSLGGIEAGVEVQLRALLQTLLETLGRQDRH